MLTPWKKNYGQPRQHIKKQRYYFANKGLSSQCYGFSSSHVWMWEWDYKESWGPKNWCFWTVVLEKTLESPMDWKEIQPVHPKGNHSWIFIGRVAVEAETSILWPPDVKSWLIWKDPDAGKDWRWVQNGMTEDEKVGWHHSFSWCEFLVNSRSWWWIGKPGVLQSMGSQIVGNIWVTELNWESREIRESPSVYLSDVLIFLLEGLIWFLHPLTILVQVFAFADHTCILFYFFLLKLLNLICSTVH